MLRRTRVTVSFHLIKDPIISPFRELIRDKLPNSYQFTLARMHVSNIYDVSLWRVRVGYQTSASSLEWSEAPNSS